MSITFFVIVGAFLLFIGILLDALAKALRNDGYGDSRSLDRISIWANLLGAGMALISVAGIVPIHVLGWTVTPIGMFIVLLAAIFIALLFIWLFCKKNSTKQPPKYLEFVWYILFRWQFSQNK